MSTARLPTGPRLLVEDATTTGEGQDRKTTYTPRFWLSTADDGSPHIDGFDLVEKTN